MYAHMDVMSVLLQLTPSVHEQGSFRVSVVEHGLPCVANSRCQRCRCTSAWYGSCINCTLCNHNQDEKVEHIAK